MIVFEQISKAYPGGYKALQGVSFSIAQGEFVVLTGHSGAGKSTLLKMIPVIERPSSGTVSINGEDVSALPTQAIPYLRRNLGLVLQESHLLTDRNVIENVILPLDVVGLSPREALKRAHAALERVGLKGRDKDMPQGLSGGEQQRVAIARAIVNRPSILLTDEPTAHLDPDYAKGIADLFRSFNRAGVTVLVSTHDPALFLRDRGRKLTLSHGLLIGDEQ